jgi:transposase
MSTKELQRVEVMGRVASAELLLSDAAESLQLSYRQTRRLAKRYREQGAAGLQHRNAGRPSHRAKPFAFRQQVLGLIRAKYSGSAEKRFGPTLAAEQLAEEDGLHLNEETLRRWMLEVGLWSRQRGRKRAHRRRRPRKEHFGELVQLDGSFHAWFEERGPHGCLMNMVDDATGDTHAWMGEQETTWAAATVLRGWIEQRGVPLALYTDWKNVYKIAPTPKQQLRGEEPLTQFGSMCARLGIRIIAAHSPQAKGRVERKNGVHQDRLVKKLRRKGICDYAAANAYLREEYLSGLNQRFACPPAHPQDYHRAKPSTEELDATFRLQTKRSISNDWVVRYQGRYLQLLPSSRRYRPRQAQAVVYESEDGRLEVHYRGERITCQEIPAPQRRSGGEPERPTIHVPYARPRPKPGHDHAYNRGYEERQKRQRWWTLKRAAAARAGVGACVAPERTAESAVPGCTPAPTPAPPTNSNEGTFLSS